MTDLADWLDEPYPLDHSITWREHYARKERAPGLSNGQAQRILDRLVLGFMKKHAKGERDYGRSHWTSEPIEVVTVSIDEISNSEED